MPYVMIHAPKWLLAMWAAVVLFVGIAFVRQPVIMTNNVYPVFAVSSSLSISLAINSNGPSV